MNVSFFRRDDSALMSGGGHEHNHRHFEPGTLYEHVDSEDACIKFCRMYGEFCKKYYNEKYPDEAVGDKLMLSFQTIIMISSLIFSFVSKSETSLPVYISFFLPC